MHVVIEVFHLITFSLTKYYCATCYFKHLLCNTRSTHYIFATKLLFFKWVCFFYIMVQWLSPTPKRHLCKNLFSFFTLSFHVDVHHNLATMSQNYLEYYNSWFQRSRVYMRCQKNNTRKKNFELPWWPLELAAFQCRLIWPSGPWHCLVSSKLWESSQKFKI